MVFWGPKTLNIGYLDPLGLIGASDNPWATQELDNPSLGSFDRGSDNFLDPTSSKDSMAPVIWEPA